MMMNVMMALLILKIIEVITLVIVLKKLIQKYQPEFESIVFGFWSLIFSVLIISIQTKYSLFKIPQDIYFMDHIPFLFSISKYMVVLIIVCILSIIASWLPTLRFKSLNPSNVLRYE